MASKQGTSHLASSATLSTASTAQQTTSDVTGNRSLKRIRPEYTHDSLNFIANASLVGLPSPKSPRFHGTFSPKFTSGNLTTLDKPRNSERKTPAAKHSKNEGQGTISSLSGGEGNMSKYQETPIMATSMSEGMVAVENVISLANSMSFDNTLGTNIANATSATSNSVATTASVMSGGTLVHENSNVGLGNNDYLQAPPKELVSRRSITSPEITIRQAHETNAAQDQNLPLQGQQVTSRPPSQKKHECPHCETEFTRYHNLKSHLLTHSQEKPYICQTCSMRFRRLHDLKRHMKLHTGERPHVCPKCNRKFARGDALARHAKGQGGCAGRRSSVGSFGADDDLEDSNAPANSEEADLNSTMHASSRPQTNQNEIIEERRKFNLPSIQTQRMAGSGSGDSYGPLHPSSTYPQSESRLNQPSGTLHPSSGNPVGSGYTTSAHTSETGLTSYTPSVSLSTLSPEAKSNMAFSQIALNKSLKPSNSVVTKQENNGTSSTIRHKSPGLTAKLQSRHYGGQQPTTPSSPTTSLTASQRPKLPALTNLAPPDQRFMLHSQVTGQSNLRIAPKACESSSTSVSFLPEAQLSTTYNNSKSQSGIDNTNNNNLFASGEKGVWVYVQTLEERVKELSDKVQLMEGTEKNQEDKISQLSAEILSLRTQLNATTKSPQS